MLCGYLSLRSLALRYCAVSIVWFYDYKDHELRIVFVYLDMYSIIHDGTEGYAKGPDPSNLSC